MTNKIRYIEAYHVHGDDYTFCVIVREKSSHEFNLFSGVTMSSRDRLIGILNKCMATRVSIDIGCIVVRYDV